MSELLKTDKVYADWQKRLIAKQPAAQLPWVHHLVLFAKIAQESLPNFFKFRQSRLTFWPSFPNIIVSKPAGPLSQDMLSLGGSFCFWARCF